MPLSRISSVGVTDVRVWDDPSISVIDLTAHHSWVLTFDVEPPVVVAPHAREDKTARQRKSFTELMDAM